MALDGCFAGLTGTHAVFMEHNDVVCLVDAVLTPGKLQEEQSVAVRRAPHLLWRRLAQVEVSRLRSFICVGW